LLKKLFGKTADNKKLINEYTASKANIASKIKEIEQKLATIQIQNKNVEKMKVILERMKEEQDINYHRFHLFY